MSLKEEWNNAVCSNTARPGDKHTKSGQEEKTGAIRHHLHVESTVWPKCTCLHNGNRVLDREQTEGSRGRGLGERWNGKWGLAHASFYIQNISNQEVLKCRKGCRVKWPVFPLMTLPWAYALWKDSSSIFSPSSHIVSDFYKTMRISCNIWYHSKNNNFLHWKPGKFLSHKLHK